MVNSLDAEKRQTIRLFWMSRADHFLFGIDVGMIFGDKQRNLRVVLAGVKGILRLFSPIQPCRLRKHAQYVAYYETTRFLLLVIKFL